METFVDLLPLAAILWPLILLAICTLPGSGGGLTPWLASAPLPAMLAALFSCGRSLTLSPSSVMPFTLEIGAPGAVLLGVSALLWALAAFDLPRRLADSPHRKRFSTCWLLTLTGNLSVFMAGDVMGFFVFYAMASLSAYGLVIHEETPEAKRAGMVYLGFALLGEAVLLMGLVLLVHNPSGGEFHIAGAVAGLQDSPWRASTILLLLVAFGLKIGLLPGHGWLPLAHSVAPGPASAVLSGAILNAGVMGMISFVPYQVESSGGIWLVGFGFATAFFGVAVGLTQHNPKAVLAYSSVSQMGFIAAVCGMAMIFGTAVVALPVAFYAAHHTLVKGGLFLATGVAETRGEGRFAVWAFPSVLIGLGLAGLPFMGGMLAKVAVKDILGDEVVGWLSLASAVATACLMTHFVFRLVNKRASPGQRAHSTPLMVAWLLLALAALLVPWGLHSSIETISLQKSLTLSELWKAFWPVGLGALIGVWLGLRCRLPQIPAGDVFCLAPALGGIIRAIASRLETGERFLRRWETGGAILVGLVALLALLLCFVHS